MPLLALPRKLPHLSLKAVSTRHGQERYAYSPYIDTLVHNRLWVHPQRFFKNNQPASTYAEVLTVYLFGLLQQQRTVKQIHRYSDDHLRYRFPNLPSYVVFVQRLNRLCEGLPDLFEQLLGSCPRQGIVDHVRLVDSMPVVLANAKRSNQVKVAADSPTRTRADHLAVSLHSA